MNPLSPEHLKEIEEQVDFPANWFIIVTAKEIVDGQEYDLLQHICVYENEPGQEDIDSLYTELSTDEEFGLIDIADKLEYRLKHRSELTNDEFVEVKKNG